MLILKGSGSGSFEIADFERGWMVGEMTGKGGSQEGEQKVAGCDFTGHYSTSNISCLLITE